MGQRARPVTARTFTLIDPAAAVPLPPTAILLIGAIAGLIALKSNGRAANDRQEQIEAGAPSSIVEWSDGQGRKRS